MNWITNFVRPRIKSILGGKEQTPDQLWTKCPSCGEMLFHRDLEAAQFVCAHCDFHMKASARQRFTWLFDGGNYEELPFIPVAADPLKFRDEKRYVDRIKEARIKTGQQDAVIAARGAMSGLPAVIVSQSFAFMGGSLGMAAGEAFVAGAERAVADHAAMVLVVASGGARMQEGILSLMQMPRATVAVQMLRDAKLPYIVILTDPTTGGVVASYAMLGDVQIAEPGATIGFSGRRVIENTIREKLPDSFQKAEYLLEHGMVDMVVHRHRLAETIGRLIALMTGAPLAEPTPDTIPAAAEPAEPPPAAEETKPPAKARTSSKAAAPAVPEPTIADAAPAEPPSDVEPQTEPAEAPAKG